MMMSESTLSLTQPACIELPLHFRYCQRFKELRQALVPAGILAQRVDKTLKQLITNTHRELVVRPIGTQRSKDQACGAK